MHFKAWSIGGGLIAAAMAFPAQAAESYDNCAGTIASLPAVITTQGVWCMKSDLATTITTGNAISVGANNVTIDCNGFKLGGLGGGTASQASGIRVDTRNNLTLRGCAIRGFRYGLYVTGPATGGHLVEDNRFEAATKAAILMEGDNMIVRRNHVVDIGGSTEQADVDAIGIYTLGRVDVSDNVISGVASAGTDYAMGLRMTNAEGSTVRRNVISGVVSDLLVVGIRIDSDRVSVHDNDVTGDGLASSLGIECNAATIAIRDNTIGGFTQNIDGACTPLQDNLVF